MTMDDRRASVETLGAESAAWIQVRALRRIRLVRDYFLGPGTSWSNDTANNDISTTSSSRIQVDYIQPEEWILGRSGSETKRVLVLASSPSRSSLATLW